MEELLKINQQDPELWEMVEQLKHQDEAPMEFFTNVAICLQLNLKNYIEQI